MKMYILFLGIEPRRKASKAKLIAFLLVGITCVIFLFIVVCVKIYRCRKYKPNVILLSSADEERSFEAYRLTMDDKRKDQSVKNFN